MKILKPGKVEMRKFVCHCCGCEFTAALSEAMFDRDAEDTIIGCPQTGCTALQLWKCGEPYEEPTPTQTDRERLAQLLVETTQFCNFGEKADHLIANGVTFREA